MYKYNGLNTMDIPVGEFIEIDGVKVEFPSGNTLTIDFNIRKIIELFIEKAIKAIKKNKKYQEGFKEIVIDELQIDEERIVEHLKYICQLKLDRLDTIIMLEEFIRQPESKIEKISFQTFIDNAIKKVFGDNAEEAISNSLVSSWLREKELTYVNILDELYGE